MENNREKTRFILAGLGLWGQNWMKELTVRDDCEIVAIVSRTKDNLKHSSAKYGISDSRCFTDFEKAIQESNADAMVVVPSDVHLPVIRAAVEGKLHILCEKPLASPMQEALKIGKLLSKSPDPLFMVDQTRRWRPHIFALKSAIDNNKIGKIEQVIIIHLQAVDIGGYRAAFPYPVIDDMAIHQFDLVRYLTGKEPVPVLALGGAKMDTDLEALELAQKSIQEGAAGVVFGRNIFQADNPEKLLDALIKVVKEECNPEEMARDVIG